MKKGRFISFLVGSFVFISSFLPAQTYDQKIIKFEKNRKVSRGQGVTILKSREINFQKKDFSLNLSKSKKTKRVYLKLKQSPTKSLQKKLKKYGITLKEYVSDNTYVVELNKDKLKKLKGIFAVNGFAEIDYSDKISERLYKGNFSNHAKDGTYVKVIVSFYKDVSYANAINWIQSVGGIVESEKFTRTHKLNVSIHQMNIQNLAKLDVVKYVDEISPPPQTHNIDAGYLSEVFWDNDSGLFDTGYSLTGVDVNVAVKDGGAIYTHSDFGNRLTIIDNDSVSDHATHVAGTIGGELAFQDNTGGMAGDSDLYSYSFNVDGNPPQTETDFTVDYVSAVNNFISLINNSWGRNIGWYWDEEEEEWDNEDTGSSAPQSLFGDYTSDSEDLDDFIYDYFDNDALIIKSAGNDRVDGPSQTSHDGEYLTDNEGIASGHYRCVEPLSCSKNNITIGSVGDRVSGIDYPKKSSPFSSWGPTDDGRVKPDVVADGWKVKSTWDNDGYHSISGTSMSCPVVTGICALIHQSYKDMYEEYPTADIVKALLCNFAEDLGKKGPDFAYGFGLVNAKKCIDAVENSDSSDGGHIVTEVIAETSDYMEYQFTIGENETDNETVTLVWIDPAANPSATNAIVNDLDITVSFSGSGYLPFYHKEYDDAPGMGSEEPTVDPTKEAKIGYNRYDTVEQVLIEPDNTTGVIPAGTYIVRVSGFKVPVLNQPFAVVSSIGFNELHYNVLRVKGQEGAWVSNQFSVLDKNPDVLMKVTYFDTSSYPTNVQYSYSTNSGTSWSSWASVTGVYEDKDCTEPDNTSTSISYIKKDSVPFDNVSSYDNRVKFKLTYDGSVKESSFYVVRNDNTYYVSTASGDDDNDGKGTKLNPWATIDHAMDYVVATSSVPALIRVEEGTYSENIELEENVYLYGGYDSNWVRDIENNETIIQGDGTTHVVVGEDYSILDGFTIKGGKATRGGGIYLYQTSPTIENCTIKDNYAEDDDGSPAGAGIYAYDSEAIIKNCTITNNTTTVTETDNTGFGGGACFISSSIQVENCIFEGNEVTTSVNSYARGGGIYLESDDSKIINSLIKSNQAYSIYNALGGGIFINEDSTSKLLGNIIILNDTAPYYFGGDGIFILDASDSAITNCTVYGNSQEGIWSYDSCCNITNTIIWNHSADDLYGTLSSSKITYCDIQDGDFDGVNGNMDDNPLFRDVSSEDFRLVNTSPCIDAGNDGAPSLHLLTKDFQGQKRVFEFDNSGMESVDIGADEYVFGFSSSSGMTMDNDGITVTWESLSGITYYIEYTNYGLIGSPSPVLQYKMNDNDNDSVVVESISSSDGTFMDNLGEINTEDYSNEGRINTTLSFNGSRYIDCGNTGNITTNISITAWIYLSDALEHRNIITKAWNNAYRFRVSTDRKLWFLINDGVSYEVETSDSTISTGQWVHVAVIADFTSQEVKFYINGQLDNTESTSKAGIDSSSADLLIGAFSTTPLEPWKGYLDDIRIYDYVLTEGDINNIYYEGVGTEDKSPLSWVTVDNDGITGQATNTSWIDDGTEIIPTYDNDSIDKRFYRIFFDN